MRFFRKLKWYPREARWCSVLTQATVLVLYSLLSHRDWWGPKYTQVETNQVLEAHQLGLCVAVWTPDSKKAFRKMIRMGVDANITNRPDRLMKLERLSK